MELKTRQNEEVQEDSDQPSLDGSFLYDLDIQKANESWGSSFSGVRELFSTEIILSNRASYLPPTHLLGQAPEKINLIPYNDKRKTDQIFKDIFKSGDFGIAIKHHSNNPKVDDKERIKFQCTHIELVFGLDDGVMTVNNPRDYQNGLFGDPSYPMIFIKPVFPIGLSPGIKKAYVDNLRTWAVIANTFTEFPRDYNGGDPLTVKTPEEVIKFGNRLINALLGKSDAIEFFQRSENLIYCAELAYISMNLGLYMPLNPATLGLEKYSLVKKAIEEKTFIRSNENPYIDSICLTTAPSELQSIDRVLGFERNDLLDGGPFGENLAILPFTLVDMIEYFIKWTIPRESLGEWVAQDQANLLKKSLPGLLDSIGVGGLSDLNPKKKEILLLMNELISLVGKEYESYGEFRDVIRPVLLKLRSISSPKENGEGAFIPPHCFLVRATEFVEEKKVAGIFGWEYVGHGIHEDFLSRRA